MTKVRQFSIVFHNVVLNARSKVQAYFESQNPKKMVVAQEPYPDQDGFHIHVFIVFENPRSFTGYLKSCIDFSSQIVAPEPEGEHRDWGRVQLDRMYGTFEQATKYLTAPAKQKEVDPDVIISDNTFKQSLQKYEQSIAAMSKIYWYPSIGKYLTLREYIEYQISENQEPDFFQHEIYKIFRAGPP